jgi:hypothetical protein
VTRQLLTFWVHWRCQGLDLDLIDKNDHVIVVASSHLAPSSGVFSGIYSVNDLLAEAPDTTH